MNISDNGLHLIESFEGFVGHPYWDPYGHVWTRGFGETEGITQHSPTISFKDAQNHLRYLIERRYEPALHGLPLNQNQFDALCSFVWNLGTGIVSSGTTVGKYLHEHNWRAAGDAMLMYDHAGGQVLIGLFHRRQQERALFLTGVHDPLDVLMPTERKVVNRFDYLKHRNRNRSEEKEIIKLVAEMRKLRHDIYLAAEHGNPKGWGVRNRQDRFHILWVRSR